MVNLEVLVVDRRKEKGKEMKKRKRTGVFINNSHENMMVIKGGQFDQREYGNCLRRR